MKRSCIFNCKKERFPEAIEQWMYSEELCRLVCAFHGTFPEKLSVGDMAKWLLEFSSRWDYRGMQRQTHDEKTGENARWQVHSSEITDAQKQVVSEVIGPLGLVGVQEPAEKEFDYILALGGARFSCLYRPRYIRELLRGQEVRAEEIILLSGMRPVGDTERLATDTYAAGAETEFDLMNAGAEQVFHLKKNYHEERYYNENRNMEWALRRYDVENGIPVVSMSGPSSEPEKRRANSADTYRFFMERYRMEPGRKLLLVTSQIYVPYQQIEAVRMFSEMYVETVGFPTEWSSGLQGMMEPANYLQEIRSAVQAINRYLEEGRSGKNTKSG